MGSNPLISLYEIGLVVNPSVARAQPTSWPLPPPVALPVTPPPYLLAPLAPGRTLI